MQCDVQLRHGLLLMMRGDPGMFFENLGVGLGGGDGPVDRKAVFAPIRFQEEGGKGFTGLPDAIPDVAAELAGLRAALDQAIPPKALDFNLLIATWNIRSFGNLTEKWHAETNDSPKRDLNALLSIAEIISRFDVIALQEVRGNIKALRHMLKVLGPDWSFTLTDVSLFYRLRLP